MQIFKSLIEDLALVLKRNKWILWCVLGIAFALVVFFLIMGGVSDLARSRSQNQATASTTEAAATGGPAAAVNGSAELTDAQRAAIDTYSNDERSVIQELKSLPWFTPSNKKVAFSDSSYSFDGGRAMPYAITAVMLGDPKTVTDEDNVTVTNVVQETTFSVIDGKGKTTLCTLRTTKGDVGTMRTLEGSPFAGGESLTAYQAASELDVEVPDSLSSLIGGDKDGLVTVLRKWASDNAPAASLARWDQKATIDYSAGQVTFLLTLNDTVSTTVKVTYRTELKTFAVDRDGE